jgi:hypothetical protein
MSLLFAGAAEAASGVATAEGDGLMVSEGEAGSGWYDPCSDHDVRDRCLIRFNCDSDLPAGAETVDARLSGLLLILSFDQRCLRHEKKWHVFPRGVLVQISSATRLRSRCRASFTVASSTKKALDP